MSQNKYTTNNNPTMVAVDATDDETPVHLRADPISKKLLVSGDLIPNVDYDYIDVQQTSDTVETYVYKLGGSGGTTIRTVVVTYTDNTKANLDKVEFS